MTTEKESFEKIIEKDGPLLRCIYPGCNIDTNARYKYKGHWLPVCQKSHLVARVARDLMKV